MTPARRTSSPARPVFRQGGPMADPRAGRRGGWPARRGPAAGKVLLLAALLAAHFALRYHAHRAVPLDQRFFHPHVYRVSLSLLAGHGFKMFRLSGRLESRPVAEFLALGRPRLTP